ncbi:MAG TPA: VOC family protein [Phycisphaerae bacterium]|nr:VOC family protein [Phycisphaerae bacterium]
MGVQIYLNFEGRTEEALAFYKKAVGAEVLFLMRCKEAPPPPQGLKPGTQDKILHCTFRIGGTTLNATDGYNSGHSEFKGISLSLHANDAAEAQRLFAGLAGGGKVIMPLGETFFSPSFGMVADPFGVQWMVVVPRPDPQ